MVDTGDIIGARFALERFVASGATGEVWRARDEGGQGPVALKLFRGSSGTGRTKLLEEAAVLAKLKHPGIVRYLAHGMTPSGQLYLAMEWLEGEDLAHHLARGPMTIDDTLTLLVKVASALAAAHGRQIVHRDIKPSNLFLEDGQAARAKVLDFGIAWSGRRTGPIGEMVGTPGYMAPEQAREEAVGPAADVFALGCVAYQCLTGRRPFEAEHPMAALAKMLLDEVAPVSSVRPDVPPALDQLVASMLAKEPVARPGDALVLGSALASIKEGASSGRSPELVLTGNEQRIVSVVVVEPPGPTAVDPAGDVLRGIVERHGLALERLMDGSLQAVLARPGVPSDLAAQAAQCALAMRPLFPRRCMSLATGRAESGNRLAGEAIDRAAGMLPRRPGTPSTFEIRVDETTAALLGGRFEMGESGAGRELRRELDLDERPRTVLGKPTTCVGRQVELAELEAIFGECSTEEVARVVFLTAAAGVGKSRLRDEFCTRLRQASRARGVGLDIWMGRGDPMRTGSPYALVAQMFRRACGITDGEDLEARRQKLRTRIAEHMPALDQQRVGDFLGEILDTPSEAESVQLRAARQDGVLMSDQVLGACQDFVGAAAGIRPLLMVFEDLHWADVASVNLMDVLIRHLRNRPIMVLALARPEVHAAFPRLWIDRQPQRIRLGGLSKNAAANLALQVLGPDAPSATMARLVDLADGNPFYLEELARAVALGRGDQLPENLVAMVRARLEKLAPDARRVLRAGSIYGQSFWTESTRALLGADAEIGYWLRDLEDQEIISRRSVGRFPFQDEYTFRHALLRDSAYEFLTEDDRRLGHTLAGQWLEQAGESDAMMIAEHFDRGAAPERALRWYPRATEQALEANDLAGALQRADRAVACGAAGADLGLLRVLQSEAHNWRGENAQALAMATQAMALLPRGEPSWYRAAREAIITAAKSGDTGHVVEIIGILRPERAIGDGLAIRRMALGWAAVNLLCGGEYTLAEQLLEEARTLEDGEAADLRARAVLDKARGMMAFFKGQPEAFALLEASIDGFDRAGDARNAALIRQDLGFVHLEHGEYEPAERLLRESLAAVERMGHQTSAPQVKQSLGLALLGLGRLDDAVTVEVEAAAALRAQSHPRLEGIALTYLARILHRKGDFPEAEEAGRRAIDLLAVAPGSRAVALAVLARALLAQERLAEALPAAQDAMADLRSLGALEEGEALIRLSLAEALLAAGDGGAGAVLAEARSALLQRASKISDRARRESFLSRVDENRQTMVLAARYLDTR